MNGFARSFLKIFKKLPKAFFSNTDFTFEWSSFLYLQKLKSKMINYFGQPTRQIPTTLAPKPIY